MTSPHDKQGDKTRHWLIPVCVLAALTHGGFFFLHPGRSLSPDEKEYVALGTSLASTGELRLPTGERAKRMPLYPAFIAAVQRWVPPDAWLNAVLCLQAMLAGCTTIMIALTAARLADPRAGLIAGVTAALYAPFLDLQMSFLTETLLIFLLSAAVLLHVSKGLQPTRRGWAAPLGVSTLIGLAVLTRANALLLIVPFVIDCAFRPAPRGQRLATVGLMLAPVLLCTGLWCVRNRAQVGAMTLSTTGGLNFYLGHNPAYAQDPGLGRADYGAFDRLRSEERLTEVQADRRLYRMGAAYVTGHPGQTVVNGLRKVLVWLRATVTFSAPTLPLLALIVIAVSSRRQRGSHRTADLHRLVHLAAVLAVVPLAVYWLGVLLQEKRLWTNPICVVPIGLVALFALRGAPHVRRLLIGLVASQLIVAVAYIPLVRIRWVIDGLFIVAIAVGVSRLCAWLAEPSSDSQRTTPHLPTVDHVP